MPNAVLDAAIIVSAFLAPQGLSAELLLHAQEGAFTVFLAEPILAQAQRVLLEEDHIRRRYHYPDERVVQFIDGLRVFAHLVTPVPDLIGISRDPNDDVILATARQAGVPYLVTRDDDLLSLGTYEGITIIIPETFIALVRAERRRSDEEEATP